MTPGDVAIPGHWSDSRRRCRLGIAELSAIFWPAQEKSKKQPAKPGTEKGGVLCWFNNVASSGSRAGRFFVFENLRFCGAAYRASGDLCRKRRTPGRSRGFGRSVEGWRQRDFRASMRAGITLWTSPTMPRSATAKIGASGSLLMAMMFLEPFMPTRCCVAPEIPAAM